MKRDSEVLLMRRERAKGRTQEQAAARAGMRSSDGDRGKGSCSDGAAHGGKAQKAQRLASGRA
jgi:hypothetical protein